MSFFFPVELTFDGRSETCAKGASERPLGDDSGQLVWRSGDLWFDYVLDQFGEAPADDQWGDPTTINEADVPREDFYVGEWLFADRRRSPIFEKLIRDTFGAK